ncbi:MAG: hypothetical protein HND57_16695 [Planctomycetes bacterium]|nr:hypothetical protein [Planctomycetota bacterium]
MRERRQRAIERMRLEQQKQRQTQQQRRQQQQTQQQRVARQRATAVVAGVGASKQGQANRHAGPHCDEPETPGESQVHRLVKDDQVYLELAMLAAQHANASRVIPAGAGAGGPIILNQRSLRQAFILKELLEPPLALRQ